MRVSRTVEVKLSPRVAWARLEDFDQWGKWVTPLGKPKRISAGRWALGWLGRIGNSTYEITDLTELSPGQQMIWFGNSFGMTSIWTFLVEPARGRTEVTIIIEENGWLASLLARWRRKGVDAKLRAALEGFRNVAEASPAVPNVRQEAKQVARDA